MDDDLEVGDVPYIKDKILKKDNTESLSKKILIEEHKIYPRALQMIARKLLKQK